MTDLESGRGSNPMKREPVAVGGALVLLIQYLARRLDWPISDEDAAMLANVLSVLILALVRQFVMPVATVKAAGLSPAAVVERADDPAVAPYRG